MKLLIPYDKLSGLFQEQRASTSRVENIAGSA